MYLEATLYCLVALSTIIFLYTLVGAKGKKKCPPSPPSVPILGHLHLLKDPEHRCLESLASRYGPVFHLRLGRCRVLMISSPEATEECFTQNDVVFADRPKFLRGEVLAYNYSTSPWAPYGTLWRNLRRVTTVEALSANRVNQSAWIREEEVRFVSRERLLSSSSGSGSGSRVVNLNEVFFQMTKNVVMRIACGKRWEIGNHNVKSSLAPQMMSIYDFFPVLRWVKYKGLEKQMREVWQYWDDILNNLLNEARKNDIKEGDTKNGTVAHQLLNLQKTDSEFLTDDIIKGIILVILTGGTDNATRTMEWAMSLLLNHPAVLHKCREEIDAKVGLNRLVSDSDLQNLPYLHSIVNETFRLFPVSPLLAPHRATADTTVCGYHVPKDTILIVNVWALHRDPKHWKDPLAFKPERFEKEQLEKTSYKLMPFGVGRRACPADNLTVKLVMLVLGTCVQCFDWETVDGKEVDMEELGGGLTLRKRLPLHALCTSRPCMAHVLTAFSPI